MLVTEVAAELHALRVQLAHVQRAQRRVESGRPGDAASLAREAQRLERLIQEMESKQA